MSWFYGLDVTFPIHLKFLVYQLLQDFSSNQDAVQNIINQLVELDEVRRRAVEKSISNQDKVKKNFDKSSKPRSFQKGDIVLLWDKRREKLGKHGKFDSLWLGPFIIYGVAGTNSFLLNNMDGERLTFPVMGNT